MQEITTITEDPEKFIVFKGLDWAMNSERHTSLFMSLGLAILGRLSAIGLGALLTVNFWLMPALYQSGQSHSGGFGQRLSRQYPLPIGLQRAIGAL